MSYKYLKYNLIEVEWYTQLPRKMLVNYSAHQNLKY